MPDAAPHDESQRLRLLHELRIVGTPPEPAFDALARLAVTLSGCSAGVLCFVDADRLWLKAAVGFEAGELTRDAGPGTQTLFGCTPVLVEDTLIDARCADSSLVVALRMRRCAAWPVLVEGHALASVAVFDPAPGPFESPVLDRLADLARLAADLLSARLAAQRSRVAEARVRSASRASSDWLWETDAEGRVTWTSDSAARPPGAHAPAPIGRPWHETYRPHPRHAEHWTRYQIAYARREPFQDLIVERALGVGTLAVGVGGIPVFDSAGEFKGYRGAARDVTADLALREEAERNALELKVSEERWKFALDVSSQGVWDWDLGAGRIVVSSGWRALLGIDGDWQPSGPADWPERIHPDDVDAARARLVAHLRGETDAYQGEYRMRHHDGRWLWVLNRGRVVHRSAAGRALRIVGTLIDVTERRAAEAALRDEQAAELAGQARGRFLSRMSHEMRTPLNAMLGFMQLLVDAPDAADGVRVRGYVEHALRAGRHLLALVDDVLDLQRADEERLELRIEPVALAPLVERAIAALHDMAQECGVHLVADIDPDVFVRADAERLLQVVVSLSSNAVKYNRPAGRVRWLTQSDADRVTLIVDDSGAGMIDAQMQRLFQPFERLGRETGPIEGTGLGLIIARALTERMGGQLRVSSRPGLGTRAMVELPAAAPALEPRGAAAAAAAPLRLLYVEDNPVNALLFGEAVRMLGNVELRVAEDGVEAVDVVGGWQPDLLVLDAHLPGMTGFQVLERLRELPGLERTPAVMCSADALPDDLARARAAGFVGYWTKPIDIGRVIAELRQFAAVGR